MAPELNKENVRALKSSITYWNNIMNGKNSMRGIRGCPLCRLYRSMSCISCPIYILTNGQSIYCDGTPIEDWEKVKDKRNVLTGGMVDGPESVVVAMAELLFLMLLLPDGEKLPPCFGKD